MRFEVGETIVRRSFKRTGQLSAVETGRVVADDDRGVLTWTGPGSQVARRTTLEGETVRKMPLSERARIATMLSPAVWRDTSVLILTPPGVAHSIWWFFDPAGAFLGWYVNLEETAQRWFGGLDISDQALDIWVEPDRSWAWKDEDEFAERTGHPHHWTVEEAAGIRAEGERLIPLIEAGHYPFDGTLTGFTPDPLWTPTLLPPHWDFVGGFTNVSARVD